MYRIRSNLKNPDWPTKPDPDDLKKALANPYWTPKEKKDAIVKALQATQEKVAKAVRSGCSSMNLDWLAMVADQRKKATWKKGADWTVAWIDTSPPLSVIKTLKLEPKHRCGPWSPLGEGRVRYCYVTFEEKTDEVPS